MENDLRYTPVTSTLPVTLPPLARKEALRAATKLTKHFGRAELGSPNQLGPVRLPRYALDGRRCWVSPKPTTGNSKGWGRVIHDVSHIVFAERHPTFRAHAGGHATLEREMAEYVIAQGWLAGTLRPAVKPKANVRAVRYARVCERLSKWESRAKRANTAIRKLRQTKLRYERHSVG